MNDKPDAAIGFIGFGEAGSAIAKGIREAGAPAVAAYDVALESERRAEMERRAAEADVTLVPSVEELVLLSEVIISAVVSSVAVAVANEAAPYLRPRHIYMDLNSTSPAVKQQAAAAVSATGARFVEAAVMAGVPPLGHKVPMLLCGEAAPELVARLSAYGMCVEDFGPEIGRAAAAKMFRSVVVKGMEALFQECVLGAERYGVSDKVLDSIGDGYPGIDWKALASHLIGRTALHGERRSHEMEEVAETLKSLGIEPLMSAAAAKRIAWAAGFGLKETFKGAAPKSYLDVVAAIREAEEKNS